MRWPRPSWPIRKESKYGRRRTLGRFTFARRRAGRSFRRSQAVSPSTRTGARSPARRVQIARAAVRVIRAHAKKSRTVAGPYPPRYLRRSSVSASSTGRSRHFRSQRSGRTNVASFPCGGPAHAPDLCKGPVLPQGLFDVLGAEAANPGAEGEARRGHDLGLGPAHVPGHAGDGGLWGGGREVMAGEPERGDLLFGDDRSLLGF